MQYVEIYVRHVCLHHQTYCSNRLVRFLQVEMGEDFVVYEYLVVYNKVSIEQLMVIIDYVHRRDSLRVNRCISNELVIQVRLRKCRLVSFLF